MLRGLFKSPKLKGFISPYSLHLFIGLLFQVLYWGLQYLFVVLLKELFSHSLSIQNQTLDWLPLYLWTILTKRILLLEIHVLAEIHKLCNSRFNANRRFNFSLWILNFDYFFILIAYLSFIFWTSTRLNSIFILRSLILSLINNWSLKISRWSCIIRHEDILDRRKTGVELVLLVENTRCVWP
jgi:hypothetical protein